MLGGNIKFEWFVRMILSKYFFCNLSTSEYIPHTVLIIKFEKNPKTKKIKKEQQGNYVNNYQRASFKLNQDIVR